MGTFELVQQSPEFNVVDKIMLPPSFHLNWHNNDSLPDHQLSYLASFSDGDKNRTREELEMFGKRFKDRVKKQSFTWNGLATLRNEYGTIIIDEEIGVDSLQPVSAQRVIRENVAHNVLVGDKEMTSHQVNEQILKDDKKRTYILIIGWILFLVTLAIIFYLLYKGGFNPLSSGLRLKAAARAFYS